MKILTLEINNFLTIGTASIKLDNKGLVLIQGTNLDDKSAVSNGAGKSSIPDALCWVLYGTTARGVSADDVVNDLAGKDCSVSTVLEDEDAYYTVTRYRKYSGKTKNGVTVSRKDAKTGADTDLTKGTDKETQEVINTIMGCDLDVFTSSVYAAQEMMPNLPGMTDKNLKTLIESASGTTRLASAHEQAKQELVVVMSAHADILANIKRMGDSRTELSLELPTIQAEIDNAEAKRKDAIEEHAKVEKHYTSLANALQKNRLDPVSISSIDDELDKLKVEIAEHGKYATVLKALQADAAKLNTAHSLAKSKLTDAERRVQADKKAIADVDTMVGTPCSECGKPYHGEDLADVKVLKQKMLDESIAVEDKARAMLERVIVMEKEALEKITAYELTIPDISVLIDKERSLLGIRNDYMLAKGEHSALINNIAHERIQIEKAKLAINPYVSMLEKIQDKIDKLSAVIEKAEEDLKLSEVEVEVAKAVAAVFSPAGVRARILDTVTPYLNARTSDYLSALSDGNISAVWTTIQRNKAGDLREKFGIDVTNDKGAKMFAGLSGGEKRKVRLSCALALQDLVSSRATKPISLFIGDEIDDALDSAGLERLMGILEEKAKERGTVLIISHDNLKDWVDEVCEVVKEGGISTVAGAL